MEVLVFGRSVFEGHAFLVALKCTQGFAVGACDHILCGETLGYFEKVVGLLKSLRTRSDFDRTFRWSTLQVGFGTRFQRSET